MKNMKCYFCGANNPENMMFCRQCGAVLSELQDETQEEIIEEASEEQLEEEDPVLEYYRERLERKMRIEKLLYSKEMTRKEFQDRYIRQIEYVLALIFDALLAVFFTVVIVMDVISSHEENGFLMFILLVMGLEIYFVVRRHQKYGGMWSYSEYLRNNVTGGNVSDYRWANLPELLISPNALLGLIVVYAFVSIFLEEGRIPFEYIIIFTFIVAGHTVTYIWLGTVYDRYKENGYLPKWLEFIQRF